MFPKQKFLAYLKENGLQIKDVTTALNISASTLYRKMNGESDFFRSEIQNMSKIMPKQKVIEIFFD